MTKSNRPWRTLAGEAIEALDLDRYECAVLRGMLDWLNPHTMTVSSSVRSIARRLKLTPRGTWGILQRLIGKKIVEVVVRTKGGRAPNGYGWTNTYRLHLPGFEYNPNYEPRSYLMSRHNGVQVRTRQQSSTNATPVNYERGAHKASKHPSGEPGAEAAGPQAIDLQVGFAQDRMPACRESPTLLSPPYPPPSMVPPLEPRPQDLRSLLISLGIRGPNLDKLATSDLPLERVVSIHGRLQADHTVRNVPAALAAALAADLDIKFKSPSRLSQAELSTIAGIEQLRRSRARGGGSSAPTPRPVQSG